MRFPAVSPPVRSGLRRAIPYVALAAILAAFLPGLHAPFFGDDFVYVVGNRHLERPWTECWRFLLERTNAYEFLPLRDLSYRLDRALGGLEPAAYRWQNLLLYGLTCVLLRAVVRSLLRLFGRTPCMDLDDAAIDRIATGTMLLYAAHPAHVESVVWISGRKDLLSSLLALGSLHLAVAAMARATLRHLRLLAAVVLFLLAILAKLSVIALVAVVAALALWRHRHVRHGWGATLAVLLPFAAIAGVGFAIATQVGAATDILTDRSLYDPREGVADLALRSLLVLGYLVRIAVAPWDLRLIYDVPGPGWPMVIAVVLGLAMLALASWAAWRCLGRGHGLWFFPLAFLLWLLPYLRLVPFNTWSMASERFLVLAVAFLIAPLAVVVLRRRSAARMAAWAGLVLAGMSASAAYAGLWREPEALYRQTLRSSPRYFPVHLNYVDDVLLPARRYDEALAVVAGLREPWQRDGMQHCIEAQRALDAGDVAALESHAQWLDAVFSSRSHGRFMYQVGRWHELRGRAFDAARYFEWALRSFYRNDRRAEVQAALARVREPYRGELAGLQERVRAAPGDPAVQVELGNLQLGLAMVEEALVTHAAVLARHPGNPVAHYNVGLVHLQLRRYADAARELAAAVRCGFDDAHVLNKLGVAWRWQGDLARAERAFRDALDRHAGNTDAATNLGLVCAMQERLDDARQAFAVARAAMLRAGQDPTSLDVFLRAFEQQ